MAWSAFARYKKLFGLRQDILKIKNKLKIKIYYNISEINKLKL